MERQNFMDLEKEIEKCGEEILAEIKNDQKSVFHTQYWYGRLMDWAIKDHDFKVDLFRFVDVFPNLKTKESISNHIQEYLIKEDGSRSIVFGKLLKAASFFGATKGVLNKIIEKNIIQMANRFLWQFDEDIIKKELQKLTNIGQHFTLDILGEAVLSRKEAQNYALKVEKLIDICHEFPSANISIKISSLTHKLYPQAKDFSIKQIQKLLYPLLEKALSKKVFVNFDAESYQTLDITKSLFHEVINENSFKNYEHFGLVIQGYLKNSFNYAQELYKIVQKRNVPVTVRLVKGAYWDYETALSNQLSYENPVYSHKAQTDLNFEKITRFLLDNHEILRPAFGSHNVRSLVHAITYAEYKGLKKSDYELQMLLGMSEVESRAFTQRGHKVRVYCPVGEMLPGMSYLVRRLLENTSQMGFVKLAHYDQKSQELLKPPQLPKKDEPIKPKSFQSYGLADFTQEQERERFAQSLQKLQASFPQTVPLIIGGHETNGHSTFVRYNPSKKNEILAKVEFTSIEQANEAVNDAFKHQEELKALSVNDRCQHLEALAKNLALAKYDLAALLSFEVGKPYIDAYLDVSEAIDFCLYYSQLALKTLVPKKALCVLGEDNTIIYEPRGVSLIISPWNFPLAILCGMSVAAYVAGNPIILKPAEQSSLVGYHLVKIMLKSGFLPNSIVFLPGDGEVVGKHLVEHPQIANIAFTGSKKVGLEILKSTSLVTKNQSVIKKVICEMGGKNTAIIDDDADLDEAIPQTIKSAFDFCGQKCSALSRIFVLKDIAPDFIHRFLAATKELNQTCATLPYCDLGPVVDEEAFRRITNIVNKLKSDPQVDILYHGLETLKEGYFVAPMVFKVSNPKHFSLQEEFFAPLVAIYLVNSIEEAVGLANDSSYALTGCFFSRSPNNISYVKRHLDVGNLYINQKCSGAFVARQPFGGHKLSGMGAKAGGENYLFQFVQEKIITENTMRRGFSPDTL